MNAKVKQSHKHTHPCAHRTFYGADLHESDNTQSHRQMNQLMLMIKLYVKLTQIKIAPPTTAAKKSRSMSRHRIEKKRARTEIFSNG